MQVAPPGVRRPRLEVRPTLRGNSNRNLNCLSEFDKVWVCFHLDEYTVLLFR